MSRHWNMPDAWDRSYTDGQGSMHDLREADHARPRLLGLKSVSSAAAWAMHRTPKQETARIGFAIPKRGG